MFGWSDILFEPVQQQAEMFLEIVLHPLKTAVRQPENRDEQQRETEPHQRHADVGQLAKF